MVDLLTIQTVGVIVAAFSFVVGVANNILTSRREEKRNQQTLETRQAQFFMQIGQKLNNTEAMSRWITLINMEWNNYDEYEKKYGTDSNPELAAMRLGTLYEWNGIGYFLRKGVIDRDTAYTLCNGVSGSWLWKKFEPVIREMRIRYNMPDAFADLEFLGLELVKEIEKRGFDNKTPEGFAHYTGKTLP